MWWVTVLFNADGNPVRYGVVKGEYAPEYRDFEGKEIYDGPFDTWADAISMRDQASVLAGLSLEYDR